MQSTPSPTWADEYDISCTHNCGSSLTVFIAPIVLTVVVLISSVGYFVFHSLFDSSYKRTSASSDHGSNDSFGVDILDDEEDFDTVFLNNVHPNSSEQQQDILADDDVMNEIMMAISEVHKEEGQVTLDSNSSGHVSSSPSQSFTSPFVARTFNNLMKVKSMNVKSPTRKNGYQNINNSDEQEFGGFHDGGGVELADSNFSKISKEEDDEFFAAIDGVSLLNSPETRSVDTKLSNNSHNPFDMSLHNDDFAV